MLSAQSFGSKYGYIIRNYMLLLPRWQSREPTQGHLLHFLILIRDSHSLLCKLLQLKKEYNERNSMVQFSCQKEKF